jgi:hypothetical protein
MALKNWVYAYAVRAPAPSPIKLDSSATAFAFQGCWRSNRTASPRTRNIEPETMNGEHEFALE